MPFEPPTSGAPGPTAAADEQRPGGNRPAKARAANHRIGKYKITRRLHKGRVSHVMLGTITGIGGIERQVAIKLLQSRYAHEQRFMDSFLHEERVTGVIQHPNLVQMLDSGECEYGYYMAMEYIKGCSLADLMRAAQSSSQPVPVGVALSIAYSVAAGLHYLHELLGGRESRIRVVHRDVHPGNVMITENGFVKLIDLGDVAIEGMEREMPALLSSVSNYTPPELTTRGNVDRRGDIFSLGVLLYELTTGHPVQRTDSGEFIPPSALCPDYPADLEDLVLRMIHPDPDGRLQSAATLQFAFEDMAASYGTPLSPRLVAQFVRKVMERRNEQRGEPRNDRRHDQRVEQHDEPRGAAQGDLVAQAASVRGDRASFWPALSTLDQTDVLVR